MGEGGQIAYATYSDPARSLEWGADKTVSGTAGAAPLTLAAYGRIETAATIKATGAYYDSIVVAVDF